MADELDRFRLFADDARISAEFSGGGNSYDESIVAVRLRSDSGWQLEMSPYSAKKLARALNRVARIIEPPQTKKKKP